MIEIYGRSSPRCVYCLQAKKMAEHSELEYKYFDLSNGEWDLVELGKSLGHNIKTVPVVLVDGHYIGGAEDLAAFIRSQII